MLYFCDSIFFLLLLMFIFFFFTGCKIKALRAKTNTYIKTPVRGEEPVFVVTGESRVFSVSESVSE